MGIVKVALFKTIAGKREKEDGGYRILRSVLCKKSLKILSRYLEL